MWLALQVLTHFLPAFLSFALWSGGLILPLLWTDSSGDIGLWSTHRGAGAWEGSTLGDALGEQICSLKVISIKSFQLCCLVKLSSFSSFSYRCNGVILSPHRNLCQQLPPRTIHWSCNVTVSESFMCDCFCFDLEMIFFFTSVNLPIPLMSVVSWALSWS